VLLDIGVVGSQILLDLGSGLLRSLRRQCHRQRGFGDLRCIDARFLRLGIKIAVQREAYCAFLGRGIEERLSHGYSIRANNMCD